MGYWVAALAGFFVMWLIEHVPAVLKRYYVRPKPAANDELLRQQRQLDNLLRYMGDERGQKRID